MHPLAQSLLAGDTRALARTLRAVDDRTAAGTTLLRELYSHTGKSYIIGVTGNPGAGKSTLTDRLIGEYRSAGKRVGVLCVDPSSPYSGGAILGDRIRMQRHALDENVFIRSVATRGHLGGLSRSARDMVRVMDSFGFDVVLVETVGVGQDELEITRTAHTTLVVSAPGMGDEVQAIKAGLMETADVFCVNKADRDGSDGAVRDIELMIALGQEVMSAAGRGHVVHGSAHQGTTKRADDKNWTPTVHKCVATKNEGIKELVVALEAHRAWGANTEPGRARRALRMREEMRESLREALIDAAERALGPALEEATERVRSGSTDPYTATEELLALFHAR